ncbi:MAG: LptF/LptG family permease [Pseudomonadales bacterium]
MKLIHRYLMVSLARGFVLVTASLMALFGLFDFMARSDEIGEASFTAWDAVLVTALAMPARVIDLSPFIALLGVVYGLSAFVRTHELVAMRAAGMSPLNLSGLCGAAALAFMAVIALAEIGARPLAQQSELQFMTATSPNGAIFTAGGIWIEQDDFVLHLDSLAQGGEPSGVRAYRFTADGQLDTYLQAQRASIDADGTWLLERVLEKRYPVTPADTPEGSPSPGPETVRTRRQRERAWQPALRGSAVSYELPLETLSLQEIHGHVDYLEQAGKPSGAFALEFWHRSLLPVAALVFTLFAAPFVLGVGPRASMGGAVTIGVANALLLFLAQQLLTNSIFLAFGTPLLAVLTPLLAVAGLAAWLVRRVNGRPIR